MITRNFLFDVDDTVYDDWGCKGYVSMACYDGVTNVYEIQTALRVHWMTEGKLAYAFIQHKMQEPAV